MSSDGRWSLIFLLGILLLVSSIAQAASVNLAGAGKVRVDLQTFIVSPAAPPGWCRVNAFIGFSVLSDSPSPGILLLPVDGIPDDVRAQAMSAGLFDGLNTHSRSDEGAFYRRAMAERDGMMTAWGSACLTLGPPAWLMAWQRADSHGAPLTAVIPPESCGDLPAHQLREARILVGEESLKDVPDDLRAAAAEAIVSSPAKCAIAVFFDPATAPSNKFTQLASSGVRVSFLTPLRRTDKGEALNPCMAGGPGASVGLTRVYAESGRGRVARIDAPRDVPHASSAQGLVNRVLAGFGYSEKYLEQRMQESARMHADSVRCLDGSLTSRLAWAGMPWSAETRVLFADRPLSRLSVLRAGAGEMLRWSIWPLAAVAYLSLGWFCMPFYTWLAGVRVPTQPTRAWAVMTGLGPVLTPLCVLRYLSRHALSTPGNADAGALDVLSPREQQALARLLTWILFAAVHLLIVLFFVRSCLWLCFG